jgi:hypothetical protein
MTTPRWLDRHLPAGLVNPATTLASAALAGRWRRAELVERLTGTGLLDPVAAEELAVRLLDLSPRPPHGTAAELADLLAELPDLDRPISVSPPVPQWRRDVPQWSSAEELAAALDLDVGELSWFADIRGWNRRANQPLRHYQPRWLATRSGGWRLIEAPKPRLAELQRRLLRKVLAKLPLHDAAHGFRPGHSVASFAAPHASQALVVRLDVEGFFATVTLPRVHGLLREVGYPPAVARLLAGLLTTITPVDVLAAAPDAAWRLRRKLAIAHLPQGAPSSPAVANLAAYRLDTGLPPWPSVSARTTPGTPTTSPSPAHRRSHCTDWFPARGASRPMKDSGSARTKPGSPPPTNANGSPGWWSTPPPPCPEPNTTRCEPCCTTASAPVPPNKTTPGTRISKPICAAASPGSPPPTPLAAPGYWKCGSRSPGNWR